MRYILIISVLFCVQAFAAESGTSRVGVDRYDMRTKNRNIQRSSVNTPPSHYQDSNGAYFRGVIPYRSYENYKGFTPSVTGSYYQPLKSDQPIPTYPKTATGLNISNLPQNPTRLPYLSSDTRGIQSGMPNFEKYNANKILAQTYAAGSDLRPFTEDIKEFEYYLKERNYRTPEQLQLDRGLLAKKYMIDASENMLLSQNNAGTGVAADVKKDLGYDIYKSPDPEDFLAGKNDIFEKIREEQKTAGIENGMMSRDEVANALNQETMGLEGSGVDNKGAAPDVSGNKVDITDRSLMRREARKILGSHTTFAGYAEDKFNSYMKKAEDFMDEGEYYKAADAYSLAAIFRKDDPLVYAGKSLALFGAGEYMSSSYYLNKALMIYPDYIAVKVDMIELLGDRDVLENRIVDIQRWMARSGSGELSFLLAYIYYQMDKSEWAKEELEKAVDKLPNKDTAKLLADMVGANIEKAKE